MRLKSAVLGTTAAFAISTASAGAQVVPAGQDRAGFAGTTGAPATPASGEAVADAADIIVTGVKRSIQSAQAIKRNSTQVIDSVVAEDIGKLPDVAVSDVAARIVGVQVERGGGEASRVLVRGLPNFTTTYNGREIFTAEARSVALQDFPAGAIAALEVFKTTTSDLVEGGLAGEVNVRSRKPFDFDGFHIAGAAWGQYAQRSGKVDPNGNLLVTDRWQTGIGEIGALVNVSFTELHYLDSTRSNTDFSANPPIGPGGSTVFFPDIQRTTFGQGDRQRPSVNAALQWKPSDRLSLYGEALWQGFRNKVADHEYTIPLYGAQLYSNIILAPNNVIQSLTAVNPNRPEGFQGATLGTTDTYQYAIGGTYDAGPLKISADIARTASKFVDSVYSFDTNYAAPVTVDAATDTPQFTIRSPLDPRAASTYIFRGFFDRQLIARGEDLQARLDFTYDTKIDFLPKIEFGARYVDRDSHFEDGSRYSNQEANRIPLSAVPVTLALTKSGFPSEDPETLRSYLSPTYDSIRSNVAQLRTLVGFPAGSPSPDPSVTYSANEKSYAGYLQAHYAFGSDTGIRFDGAFGVRYVGTDLSIAGSTVVRGGPITPLTVGKNYDDWLPNASVRVRFTDELQFRFSATKTRTRPDFGQYNPGVVIDPANVDPLARRFGNGGNPLLNPLKSNNYDASLEYYFAKAGSASVAIFRRDLNGFIQNYQTIETDAIGPILITRPYNSGAGRIDGAEAAVTAFADFASLPAWARGFGVQANITYLDAKTGFPAALGGTPATAQLRIVGVSRWTYNADLIYEYAGLSTRLSYNLRSGFPSSSGYNDGFRNYTESTGPIGRLDVSASYDLLKNLTLTADATNILGHPLRLTEQTVFTGGPTVVLPRSIRYEESVYSLGVRFRF